MGYETVLLDENLKVYELFFVELGKKILKFFK